MLKRIPHSASTIDHADFEHIPQIIAENYVGFGPFVRQLEADLVAFSGHTWCKAVNSGSNALTLALLALKTVHPSKKNVITSAYICPAVWHAIRHVGLNPILVDINTYNLNISITDALNKETKDTLCFLIPHTAGIPVDTKILREKTQAPIIEDCAQSIGSRINDNPVGMFANLVVYSFGSTKMITGGIGGAVLTRNSQYADIISEFVKYENTPEHYQNGIITDAYNMDLADINAGVIISQLKKLPGFIQRRREIALHYDAVLTDKPVAFIREPKELFYNRFRYYFCSDHAIDIILKFQKEGIDARGGIAHNFSSYLNLDLKSLNTLHDKTVSLPIYPLLEMNDLDYIINKIKKHV